MGTMIIGVILVVVIGLVIRSMVLDRKNGRACSGSCASCKGCSHSGSDQFEH
ncbi:MAG: FeoB-associated Cys-rich membrane protein [Lachnospiraceae bacterium]|jgi:hypothetical protein|nr:FeoB-associated Cys-rich membrane protein [Lachnospiraceae bacterium]